jgi:C_GCAxxG_C_C family probable redox protein
MKSRIETAVQHFADGYNCAQSVFTTYAPLYGVGETDAVRIATGFGGGMGHLQEVCGAVTGAFMVIGCCCGMRQHIDKEAKDRTDGLVHELGKRFASLHGSLLCRGLLGCDLSTEEGKAQFKDQKLRDTKCVGYVRDACRLLEEMLPAQTAG